MTYEEARELYQRHEAHIHLMFGMCNDWQDNPQSDASQFDAISQYADEVTARHVVDCQNIIESTDDDTGLLMMLIARGA